MDTATPNAASAGNNSNAINQDILSTPVVRERDLAVRGLRIPLYTGAAFLAEAPLDDGAVVPEFALAAAELDREEPRAITV